MIKWRQKMNNILKISICGKICQFFLNQEKFLLNQVEEKEEGGKEQRKRGGKQEDQRKREEKEEVQRKSVEDVDSALFPVLFLRFFFTIN